MTRRKFYQFISVLSLLLAHSLVAQHAFAGSELSAAEAQQLARQFYDSRGEWAGKFRIARFLKTRVESTQSQTAKFHFQYEWAFLQDPTRTGIDNRYFVYQKAGNAWHVIEMGAHQSGRP